jgi:hypothetical protein
MTPSSRLTKLTARELLLKLGEAKGRYRAAWRPLAPGLTLRAVLDKFAAIQMLDVHFPTTDGRTLILSRYTHPEPDQKILLEQLKLTLPAPPPRISSRRKLLDQI